MLKLKFILVCLSAFIALHGISQTSENEGCVLVLKEAEGLYEQGKLELIPMILKECLENGFNKEEKVKAYRLLTLTYIFDDNTEMADQTMELMLKLSPEHKINQAIDPVEFIYLYNSFRTSPVASFGISGGANISMGRLLETYSLDNSTSNTTYFSQAGFQGGIHGNYFITKKLCVNVEALYKTG
jgi:hypothetical protein